MSNLFKESLKVLTSKVEVKDSPLAYELPKETKLDDKETGKYGVLGNEKFEKNKEDKIKGGIENV